MFEIDSGTDVIDPMGDMDEDLSNQPLIDPDD